MRFHLVDAFTDRPFAGNTAGVVPLDAPADPVWMQSIAAELKHPETAFVVTSGDGPKPLRWFTPAAEVDLCGHATLATAHVLGGNQVFSTRSGELRAATGTDGWIHLDFPADESTGTDDERRERVAAALPTLSIDRVTQGSSDLMAVVPDAAQVRALTRDIAALAAFDTRAVIITAPGDRPGIDCVSRVFAPGVGIDEDPVTGSAHCTLAPYWADRLGRTDLVGEQASARGGIVRMTLSGERVRLSGQAITVAEGDLLV